jgi:hypothetical protein
MIVILPVSLLADDTEAAVLRSNSSGVLLNKSTAPATSALFRDDLVETQKDAMARIETAGSTADINPETVIQFEGDELVLEHGTVSVNTARAMKVRVGCLTVTPVNDDWTHYDVTDVDGKVTVSALKNDVNIDSRAANARPAKDSGQSNRVTVREGEQKSREEKCGGAEIKNSSGVPAIDPILNSVWAKGVGIGIIGGIACFALCRGAEPISPWHP